MDRRSVVTGALCAAAALAASAAMTVLVPPQTTAHPRNARAGLPDGTAGAQAPTPLKAPATPAADPAALAGALFEHGLDGGHHCTATVVRSPGRNLIVTAGHCLAAGPAGQDTVFAPGWNQGKAPHGAWRVEEVFEDPRWSDDGDDAYDLAFARLAPDAQGRRVEDVVGGAELDTGARSDEPVTVRGYPSDRDVPRTCTAPATRDGDSLQRFACADFPTGTSGSAWIAADGRIIGVLTGGDTDDESTSTLLGGYARALYDRATAAR
ncbi:trypsin-like serine peptidase [Streptomyces sp. NPDC101132]|uniref:trypsin-like serine peptidase n=1 Tax=Streptomyces sp. NPDC101132 TaxID=3366110 RepID=UPI0038237D7D